MSQRLEAEQWIAALLARVFAFFDPLNLRILKARPRENLSDGIASRSCCAEC
jgi:hypothetical protein